MKSPMTPDRSSGWIRAGLTAAVLLTTPGLSRAQTLLWDRSSPPFAYNVAQTLFGGNIWVVSDFDGDGVRDLLAGTWFEPYYGILSGATGNAIAEVFGAPGDGLAPTGSVGDVNGDGFIDFLIVHMIPPGSGYWYTELVSGATLLPMSTVSNYSINYGTPLGDVNGDGFGDFVVRVQTGLYAQFYVAYGPTGQFGHGLAIPPAWSCYSNRATVAACGDIDQDGVAEILIGYPCYPPSQYPQGLGYAGVFSGATGTAIWSATGPSLGSHFGEGIASPGDVNGDGVPDVVVSTPWAALTAWSGGNGLQVTMPTTAGPPFEAAGDVDGDGVGDFAARGNQVEIFSGVTMTPIHQIVTNLPTTPWQTGYLVGSALAVLDDFSGDGYPEIVIGAPSVTTAQPGRIQCYTLRPSGLSVFGNGCPQSNGTVARIATTGSAFPNAAFNVNLSKVPPAATAALVVGLSNTQFGSIPLPWQVDPVLAPGCFLHCSIDWCLPTVTTSATLGVGGAVIVLPVPQGTSGLTFYAQWGIVNPPGAPTLASVTRALAVTIQ